jgi:uncharacterized membrane protein YphA (DoxX/SURF4 family)
MLSVFPIMFLSLLAHAILRVITGGVLIYMSGSHIRSMRAGGAPKTTLAVLAFLELILGGMMVIGILTQIAALATVAVAIALLIARSKLASYLPSASFFILLIAISLSLVITGAGALAVDMPF